MKLDTSSLVPDSLRNMIYTSTLRRAAVFLDSDSELFCPFGDVLTFVIDDGSSDKEQLAGLSSDKYTSLRASAVISEALVQA
ncbi:hypothetical protein NDU88_004285 [Pleurodeles waltl]|uniref:Uncharacterized protein n=1 Tax=Pleurodeles waltl TaxID=8319 RepID=A0AAV7RL40_PLEWA|nr:hypothetical protein NDU88_004285 [Pleurodeles waltl]